MKFFDLRLVTAFLALSVVIIALHTWKVASLYQKYPAGQCIYDAKKHEKLKLDKASELLAVQIDKISWNKTSYFIYDPKCWVTNNYYRNEPCWKDKTIKTFYADYFKDYKLIGECPYARDYYLDE